MAQCDAARLNTAETAADDDPYAGVLDIGATGPLTELAKIGRLFLRGGVAEDGTRVVSEAALRIAMQPVGEGESHCDCFKYGSGDAGRKRCEYRMRDFCAGDYWGLGACFKAAAGKAPRATLSSLLEELHSSGKSVEQVAAQAPWPRWMVWGGWCAIAHPANSPPPARPRLAAWRSRAPARAPKVLDALRAPLRVGPLHDRRRRQPAVDAFGALPPLPVPDAPVVPLRGRARPRRRAARRHVRARRR
jgi:hypothetical protein